MKIEAGKLYRTRNGMKVRIYATDVDGELPIHGAFYYPENSLWEVNAWRENGIDGDYEPDFDIIGEWKEPLDFDPDCLPAWAEWIALESYGEWLWYRDEPAIYDDLNTWVGEKSYGVIPKEYSPKNFKGHWKESLFLFIVCLAVGVLAFFKESIDTWKSSW